MLLTPSGKLVNQSQPPRIDNLAENLSQWACDSLSATYGLVLILITSAQRAEARSEHRIGPGGLPLRIVAGRCRQVFFAYVSL
jgi:hypothetical protein